MPELVVATYNTHRERKGRDRLLDELLQEGRSLVCLQEVSPVRAARIKHAFGPRSFVSVSKHGFQYLAIVLPEDARFLSRRTVQLNGHLGLLPTAWSVNLGHVLYRAGLPGWTDALEPRVAQGAHVSWRGVDLQLINTHLPFTSALRNKSLMRLQETLQGENVILAGDLNATPGDLFLNDLVLDGGLSLTGSHDATHDGGRRIDYVMFKGDFRETGYSLEEGFSDHRLVKATLEV
jgi:endonuclease/exonuclease/phosphatase family metal-dependent hydrolase